MYTLVPKPYVVTRLELASVPGLARCFLGDLTNFVFLHPIVSNREVQAIALTSSLTCLINLLKEVSCLT